jgi:hypothetical protein
LVVRQRGITATLRERLRQREHAVDQIRDGKAFVAQEATPLRPVRPPLRPRHDDSALEQYVFAHAIALHQPERFGVGEGLRRDRDHVRDEHLRCGMKEARNFAGPTTSEDRTLQPP